MGLKAPMAGMEHKPMALLEQHQCNIRRPIFSGLQPVAGIWFPDPADDDARVRQQILVAWRKGADLHRFPGGLLLRFADAEPVQCKLSPGWPLCRVRAALASAPLTEREMDGLAPADLYLVTGAQVTPLRIADSTVVDAAEWIDLEDIPLHDTFDFADTVAVPETIAPPKRAVREVLGGAVPPPSEAQSRFLAQLAARRHSSEGAGRETPRFGGGAPGLRGGGIGLMSALLAPLLRLRSVRTPGPNSTTVSPRQNSGVAPQQWRQWLSRFAMITRLSGMLGWRQAAYMRKVLQLFDKGDLGEALRHAIPLGDDRESLGQSFGTPGPRHDLSLSKTQGPSTGIGLDPDLDSHLRKLYRAAFERLDQAGRIDEAVFVLAELLGSHQEAVDYLLKHERTQQAAELALSWDLPAETIVRLLCLSGDWDRAMQVARRDNAFASAVIMLEKQRPELARRLRLEWAQALAERGDWVEAVDAVWPVKQARIKAADWLQMAEAAGGALEARALVQRAVLLPDTLEHHAERIVALRDDPTGYGAREELARALLAVKATSAAATGLGGAMLPVLLADRLSGHNGLTKKEFTQLIKRYADRLLKSDLPTLSFPPLPPPRPLEQASAPLQWDAPVAGLQPMADVVCLSDGQYLIAQGEAGMAVVCSQGTEKRRYAVPSDRLVISDNRRIVLGLAKRDSVWHVTRVNLVSHDVTDLGVAALEHFATGFDGIGWTIVSKGHLYVLDTTHSLRDVLWHVSDLPGQVMTLHRSENDEVITFESPSGPEYWHYRLPERRLSERGALMNPGESADTILIRPNAIPLYVSMGSRQGDDGASGTFFTCRGAGSHTFTIVLPESRTVTSLDVHQDWLVAGLGDGDGHHLEWWLIHVPSGTVKAKVMWPGFETKLRSANGVFLFFDQRGRILKVTPEDGSASPLVLK